MRELARQTEDAPGRAEVTVDLEAERIHGARRHEPRVHVGPRVLRKMLLDGVDEVGLTLSHGDEIAAFQASDRQQRPWVHEI